MESDMGKNREDVEPASNSYFKMLKKKYINLPNIIWYVIIVIVKIIAEKGEKKSGWKHS